MVSNKLTARRETVPKPPVCKKPPFPPPIVPPPPWPPLTFNLHFQTDYTWDGIPYHVEFNAQLEREWPLWNWGWITPTPPPFQDAFWFVDYERYTAELHIRADNPPVIIVVKAYDIEVTWDTPTAYEITVWNEMWPPAQTAVATFTF